MLTSKTPQQCKNMTVYEIISNPKQLTSFQPDFQLISSNKLNLFVVWQLMEHLRILKVETVVI